jgi:hypothetical protein
MGRMPELGRDIERRHSSENMPPVIGTCSAASGSIEGMIFTPTPIRFQLRRGLEVVPQILLLSALLCYWINHREKKRLNWLLGILFLIVVTLSILGLPVKKGSG